MRISLAVILTTLLLGGTHLYTQFSASVKPSPPVIEIQYDDNDWRIEIERTFDCVPDPVLETASIEVQLRGETIFSSQKEIAAKEALKIPIEAKIEQGENEICVIANFAAATDFDVDLEVKRAIRVNIYRGSDLIVQHSEWSVPGTQSLTASTPFATTEK